MKTQKGIWPVHHSALNYIEWVLYPYLNLEYCNSSLPQKVIKVPPLRERYRGAALVLRQMIVRLVFHQRRKEAVVLPSPWSLFVTQTDADTQTACEQWFPDVSYRWLMPCRINGDTGRKKKKKINAEKPNCCHCFKLCINSTVRICVSVCRPPWVSLWFSSWIAVLRVWSVWG